MIYIKYNDLNVNAQKKLWDMAREHVEHELGKTLRKYAEENNTDYETLMDEESAKKLSTYDYAFNM